MNSDERRAARRLRREEKRARRKAARNEGASLEDVADLNALYKAQRQAARGVAWKASTQRYQMDWLLNIKRAHDDVLAGNEVCRGFNEFDLYERGKLRHICSVHFSERVVQKSLTQNVYVPTITPTFIADNSANMTGKGTSYAQQRVKEALAEHWRMYGPEGGALQVDFQGYFGNIEHAPVKAMVRRAILDARVIALGHHLIDVQGTRGLGLGSEPNQILAVGLPNPIDHLISECCRVEYYGRYMDDIIVIDPDKLTLQIALALIRDRCAELGIVVNERKTHIVKLSHGFTFLKTKYSYSETGKVVMRPCRDSITRERRKIKAHARMVADGIMTYEEAVQSFQSWRGSKLRIDAHGAVLRMDELFAREMRAMSDPPPQLFQQLKFF